MAVVENIDIVMGVKTQDSDAKIAKEIALIDPFQRSVGNTSVTMSAFSPVARDISNAVLGFATGIPGVTAAATVFSASAQAVNSAITARSAAHIQKLKDKLDEAASSGRKATAEIEKVEKAAGSIGKKSTIQQQAIAMDRLPRGLTEDHNNNAARQMAFAARMGNTKGITSAFMSVGQGRSKDDQAKYVADIDGAIAKTATYKSQWTEAAKQTGMTRLGVAGLAAGVGVAVAGAAVFVHTMSQVSQQMVEIDALSDSAKKLGTSFADLSTMRLSLGQTSGLDPGAIDAAISKMTIGLSDANAKQSGDVFDRLTMLGLNAADLLKAGPLDAIKQISVATQGLKDPTDQLLVAYELFGKQGAAMVSSLREGPEELERMAALAKALGMNLSDAQAEQVGAANDAWDEMTMVATGAYRQIAAEVAPVIQVIAEYIRDGGAIWQAGKIT